MELAGAIVLVVTFLILLLIGVPIAFCIGLACGYLIWGI